MYKSYNINGLHKIFFRVLCVLFTISVFQTQGFSQESNDDLEVTIILPSHDSLNNQFVAGGNPTEFGISIKNVTPSTILLDTIEFFTNVLINDVKIDKSSFFTVVKIEYGDQAFDTIQANIFHFGESGFSIAPNESVHITYYKIVNSCEIINDGLEEDLNISYSIDSESKDSVFSSGTTFDVMYPQLECNILNPDDTVVNVYSKFTEIVQIQNNEHRVPVYSLLFKIQNSPFITDSIILKNDINDSSVVIPGNSGNEYVIDSIILRNLFGSVAFMPADKSIRIEIEYKVDSIVPNVQQVTYSIDYGLYENMCTHSISTEEQKAYKDYDLNSNINLDWELDITKKIEFCDANSTGEFTLTLINNSGFAIPVHMIEVFDNSTNISDINSLNDTGFIEFVTDSLFSYGMLNDNDTIEFKGTFKRNAESSILDYFNLKFRISGFSSYQTIAKYTDSMPLNISVETQPHIYPGSGDNNRISRSTSTTWMVNSLFSENRYSYVRIVDEQNTLLFEEDHNIVSPSFFNSNYSFSLDPCNTNLPITAQQIVYFDTDACKDSLYVVAQDSAHPVLHCNPEGESGVFLSDIFVDKERVYPGEPFALTVRGNALLDTNSTVETLQFFIDNADSLYDGSEFHIDTLKITYGDNQIKYIVLHDSLIASENNRILFTIPTHAFDTITSFDFEFTTSMQVVAQDFDFDILTHEISVDVIINNSRTTGGVNHIIVNPKIVFYLTNRFLQKFCPYLQFRLFPSTYERNTQNDTANSINEIVIEPIEGFSFDLEKTINELRVSRMGVPSVSINNNTGALLLNYSNENLNISRSNHFFEIYFNRINFTDTIQNLKINAHVSYESKYQSQIKTDSIIEFESIPFPTLLNIPQPEINAQALQQSVTWTFDVQANGSADAGNVALQFANAQNNAMTITITKLLVDDVEVTQNTNGLFNIGDISSYASKKIQVYAQYSDCTDAAENSSSYLRIYGAIGGCSPLENFEMNEQTFLKSLTLENMSSNMSVAPTFPSAFQEVTCEGVSVPITITNAGRADLSSVVFEIPDIPQGFVVSDIALNDSIIASIYDEKVELGTIKGNSSKEISYKLELVCVDGALEIPYAAIPMNFIAESNCRVKDTISHVYQPRFTQFSQLDNISFEFSDSVVVIQNQGESEIIVKLENTSSDTLIIGDSTFVEVVLPDGVVFKDSEYGTPIINGSQLLFSVSSGTIISGKDSIPISFIVTDTTFCPPENSLIRVRCRMSEDISLCDGYCSLTQHTDEYTILLERQHVDFDVSLDIPEEIKIDTSTEFSFNGTDSPYIGNVRWPGLATIGASVLDNKILFSRTGTFMVEAEVEYEGCPGNTKTVSKIITVVPPDFNTEQKYCAPPESVSCTQTGYYPTAFFTQYMNLIKEFMAADKSQLLIEGTQSLCCSTCYDLSSLPSYTEFFPYNVIGHNRDGWCVGNDNYFLNFKELFDEVLDSYENDCLYYLFRSNIFQNYRELIWSVDPISGIISISIKDEYGNNVSNCDKDFFEINAKDYTYSQLEDGNNNHCSQDFIQNGYCCLVGDVNKTLITPIQYLECPDGPPISCDECIPRFMLEPGKTYVLSAWVMQSDWQSQHTLADAQIQLRFRDGGVLESFTASGPIIDGWQRIEEEFTVPITATDITVTLQNKGGNEAYFDDIRIFPLNATMKSFVYDPITGRLVAQLDENNYAAFYEYDEEGNLVRVKKETERGVKTIQESRNHFRKQ